MSDVPAWKRKLYAVKNEELPEVGEPERTSHNSSQSGEEGMPASQAKQSRPAKSAAEDDRQIESASVSQHDKRGKGSSKQSKDALKEQIKEPKRNQADQDKPGKRSTLHKATSKAARAATGAPAQELASGNPSMLRNHRKALAVFQDSDFSVEDFIAATFQGCTVKEVEAASAELVHLRDHCHRQVQDVVLEHHKVFLECCKGRGVLDEALTELRTHVQDVDDVFTHLQQAQHAVLPASATQPATGHPGPGSRSGQTGARVKPMSEAIESQVHDVVSQLEVAVAEHDYGTAVSLLGLLADVTTITNRDAHLLAAEVGDVANWRRTWEPAVDQQKKTLLYDLEQYLSRGSCSMSVMEMRGAAAALAALAGDAHAAQSLLACHATRMAAAQTRLLKHYTSEAGASEAHLHQLAGSLLQHTFIGVSAAADDVVAVWGRHATPATPLLTRWAEGQVRQAAHAVKHHALMPYADTSPLQDTLMCIQIGLVLCGGLELTHFLSLTRPFLSELWQYVEVVVSRTLRQLSEDTKAAAQQEVAGCLTALPPPADTQPSTHTLACVTSLLEQISHICKVAEPFSGPKLRACLAPALPTVLTALIDGVTAGFQQVAAFPGAHQLSRSLISHLSRLCDEDGALVQALAPLSPGCGPLLDLVSLSQYVDTARSALAAARTAAAAGQPAKTITTTINTAQITATEPGRPASSPFKAASESRQAIGEELRAEKGRAGVSASQPDAMTGQQLRVRRQVKPPDDSDDDEEEEEEKEPARPVAAQPARAQPTTAVVPAQATSRSAQAASSREDEAAQGSSKASKVASSQVSGSSGVRLRRPGQATDSSPGVDKAGSPGVQQQQQQQGVGDRPRMPAGDVGPGNSRRAQLAARATAMSSSSDGSSGDERQAGWSRMARQAGSATPPAPANVSTYRPARVVADKAKQQDEEVDVEEVVVVQSRVKLVIGSPVKSLPDHDESMDLPAARVASPNVKPGTHSVAVSAGKLAGGVSSPQGRPGKVVGAGRLRSDETSSVAAGVAAQTEPGVVLAVQGYQQGPARKGQVSSGDSAAGGGQVGSQPAGAAVRRMLIASKRAAAAGSSSPGSSTGGSSDDDDMAGERLQTGRRTASRPDDRVMGRTQPDAVSDSAGRAGKAAAMAVGSVRAVSGSERQQQEAGGPDMVLRVSAQDRVGSLISAQAGLSETKFQGLGSKADASVTGDGIGSSSARKAAGEGVAGDSKASRTRAQLRARAIQMSDSD